jgi:ABC-type sugar transport system substrate-binding protein
MEERAARDSGQVLVAARAGVVTSVTAERIRIETDSGELDEYKLQKFVRSNQGTCINQRPIVDVGIRVGDGQPIADIPYTGISAGAIGRLAGEAAAAEAARRGWSRETTGILRISFDSLETGRERTAGAVSALRAAGYPADAVKDAPQRTSDTEGAFSAAAPVLTANARYDRWIVLGLNDETVVGGVRAAEGLSLGSADIIGVGIGGSEAAIAELAKPRATGFHASVLLSPRAHGYDTAVAMYRWITAGQAPPAVTLTSGKLLTRANYRAVLAQEGMA